MVVQLMFETSSYVFLVFAFKAIKQNQYTMSYTTRLTFFVSLSPFQNNFITQEAYSSSNLNTEMYSWNWWIG